METLHSPEINPANRLYAKIKIMKWLIGDRKTRRVNDRPEMNDSGDDRRNDEHPEKISYAGNDEKQ